MRGRLSLLAALCLIFVTASTAFAQFPMGMMAAGTTVAKPTPQTIALIAPVGSCTYATGSTSGTAVCAVSVTMSPSTPSFGGTFSGSNAQFSINATSGQITLAENDICSPGPCTYSLSVTATPSNHLIAPKTQAISITSSPGPTDTVWANPTTQGSGASLTVGRGSGSSVAGGCLLVTMYLDMGATISTVSDGTADTFTPVQNSGAYSAFAYATSIVGGSTSIAVTVTGGNLYGLTADEIYPCAGVDGVPNIQSVTTTTTPTAGAITTVNSNDLIFATAGAMLATAADPASGYTGIQAVNAGGTAVGSYTNSSGTYRYFFETERKALPTAGTVTASFTSGSDSWGAGAIAFSGTPVPQVISSIQGCNGANFAPGSGPGTVVCTVTVTMQPPNPTFAAQGGTFSVCPAGGNQYCPSGGDVTDFAISSAPSTLGQVTIMSANPCPVASAPCTFNFIPLATP